MRIDSHQHFWKYNPVRDVWIDDSMEQLKNDFLPENLHPFLAEHNFQGCIAVQADQSEEETEFLLKLSDHHSFIKGVVGWVDLCSDRVEERLEYFSKHKRFVGVRHIVQAEPAGFMLKQDFQAGVSRLAQFDLTFDILIHRHQIIEAIELVKAFPNQDFVVDHLAKPNIKNGDIDLWKKDIQILASLENVFCKASGLITEAEWNRWSNTEFHKYLNVIYKAFGAKRIMFGSDWPVCLLSGNYKDVVSLIEGFLKNFSQDERDRIMGLNAINFYKLQP